MSLFATSFSSGDAGPSYQSISTSGGSKKTNTQKRKRPSLGDDKIKSTEANLQKLMKRVEGSGGGGEKKGKGKGTAQGNKEGGESIGFVGKKRVRGRKSGGLDEDENDEEVSTSKIKSFTAHKNVDSPAQGKKQKANQSTPSKSREETPKKTKGSASMVEPAELPLPHTIRPDDKSDSGEGLTKMQRDMKAKLEGARFRWINEQLYSTPSTEAVAMMAKDPKIFSDYHLTHRALTSAWPQPPLPHLISLLSPLPARTVITDLGCGDAGLAKALVPQGKIVLSYDLVGDRGMVGGGKGEGWVVEADFLSSVPLPGRTGLGLGRESGKEGEKPKGKKGRKSKAEEAEASEIVDVVVCCLSLMGVNWIGGIFEACRILKPGGTFHIAEVTSRFVSTPLFISSIESFGFELQETSSPSTHFTLFEFKKIEDVPVGPVRGEAGWNERVREGSEILRACVYKKR